MQFTVGEIYYEPRRLSLVYLESIQTDSDGLVKGNFVTLRTNFKYQTLISGETRFREATESDYLEFLEQQFTTFYSGDLYINVHEQGILIFSDGEYVSLSPQDAINLRKILNREING